MSRWLLVLGVLGLAIVGILLMIFGLPHGAPEDPAAPNLPPEAPLARPVQAAQRTESSGMGKPVVEVHNLPGVVGPLVLPNCRLTVMDRQEVPSLRDGQLYFIATEVKPGEVVPKDRLIKMDLRYPITPIKQGENVPPEQRITIKGDDKRQYRRLKEGEHVDAEDLEFVVEKDQPLRRLTVGDKVEKGQILALVDPRLALDDLSIKKAREMAARAEHVASEKTRDEAQRRFETQQLLWAKRATSKEELDGARLSYDRYRFETVSKGEAIRLSAHELKQAETVLEMHAIRSKVDGEIKAVYKNSGDAVKNLEPVFVIHSSKRLRVEGLVDLQHSRNLTEGMTVVIEPSKLERPELVLRGHLEAVTGVAVTGGPRPLIVSGSEDQTVRIWDREDGSQRFTVRFPVAIRAVACTLEDGKKNLAAAGSADGQAWLLKNFDRTTGPTLESVKGRHKGPVTCVGFSPDGKLLATGGEDHMVRIWNAVSGELLSICPPDQGHRGAVTALHFASNTDLVSVGRGDQTVLVWKLHAGSSPTRIAEFPRRSGDVADLGVSPDGQYVLFDQGKDLQVLSLKTGQIEGVLPNSSPSMNFTTMALFSPKNGKLILTASSSENRLQLYRTPIAGSRGAEIRQLMWPGSPANCGAFDPDGRFVVTGMRDRNVLVWQMPPAKEVDYELKATLKMVDRSLDSSTRQVRIAAELDNPIDPDSGKPYLYPGDTATIVIDAKK